MLRHVVSLSLSLTVQMNLSDGEPYVVLLQLVPMRSQAWCSNLQVKFRLNDNKFFHHASEGHSVSTNSEHSSRTFPYLLLHFVACLVWVGTREVGGLPCFLPSSAAVCKQHLVLFVEKKPDSISVSNLEKVRLCFFWKKAPIEHGYSYFPCGSVYCSIA